MDAMHNEMLTACYQFIAATINGTYQGVLITVLVAAILRMFRQTNAATRYAVWFGTLLLLALIIPAHCLRSRWDAEARPESIEPSAVPAAAQFDAQDMRMEAGPLPSDSDSRFEYLAADARSEERRVGKEGRIRGP